MVDKALPYLFFDRVLTATHGGGGGGGVRGSQRPLEGLKDQAAGNVTFRASVSESLVWGPRICIYNKLPGEADAGLGPTL